MAAAAAGRVAERAAESVEEMVAAKLVVVQEGARVAEARAGAVTAVEAMAVEAATAMDVAAMAVGVTAVGGWS